MVATTFNAITYANKLKKAKDTNEFAEISAEELSNLINNNLATKDDLKLLKVELQAFFIKSLIALVGVIGGLQAIFHLLKP